ncbi:MAG: TnsA endonuclease N-terminal domain-containing protein [Leptolyngbya sp. BL-A-14]
MKDDFWYESHLEMDYMYLLEIDPDVIAYRSQPFKIQYFYEGKERSYTPDLAVKRTDRRQIVEIKPQNKVSSEKNQVLFSQIAPKCSEEGWEFIVVTDKAIRVKPKLNNIKTLYYYAKVPLNLHDYINLKNYFKDKNSVSIEKLEEDLSHTEVDRTKIYRAIYYGILEADLMQPIGSKSIVRFSSITFDPKRFKIS